MRHVSETGSTNADLLLAFEDGTARDRSVLATDHQIAGRGRLDRRWDAPAGRNLLVSIVFAPVPAVAADSTHRVGLAVVAAVRRFVPDMHVALKWPNDVLLDERKLAGILAQRSPVLDGVVVGLGLNVGWAPDGAASLGDAASPAGVLQSVLEELDALPDDITALYRAELATIGRDVVVELPGDQAPLRGRATDVDDQGRLVVHDVEGRIHVLDVGDVVHVRPGESGV